MANSNFTLVISPIQYGIIQSKIGERVADWKTNFQMCWPITSPGSIWYAQDPSSKFIVYSMHHRFLWIGMW